MKLRIMSRIQIYIRSKVCRMLSEAHSQGIVEIHIKPKLSLHVDLEAQLEKKYNLKEVIVTESEADMNTCRLTTTSDPMIPQATLTNSATQRA